MAVGEILVGMVTAMEMVTGVVMAEGTETGAAMVTVTVMATAMDKAIVTRKRKSATVRNTAAAIARKKADSPRNVIPNWMPSSAQSS